LSPRCAPAPNGLQGGPALPGRPRRRRSPPRAHRLEKCRVVERLDDALADCVLVAGTTARTGGLFRRQTVAAGTIRRHDPTLRTSEKTIRGVVNSSFSAWK
jgi:hypothetical protein